MRFAHSSGVVAVHMRARSSAAAATVRLCGTTITPGLG